MGTGSGASVTGREPPAPGQAPLPADSAAILLRRNASDPAIADRPAIRFGSEVWTHGEYLVEAQRWAALLAAHRRDPDRPTHVGVLLDNLPDYLFALGGAALAGATVVGLNHTRRGQHLGRDVTHTDCDLVVTEPRHLELLAGAGLDLPVLVTRRWDDAASTGDTDVDAILPDAAAWAGPEPDQPDVRWALVFTSGTSGAPKAVICTQRRLMVTGVRMAMILDLGPDDVGYVCMPLFHSNALMVGWAPSLAVGASIGLGRRFSASGWLDDVRRYGATWFNYTGKPLSYLVATPERPDDADNDLRVAYGNEGSPRVVAEFARRFGVEVIDAFGSTEGGVSVSRAAEARTGSVGIAGEGVRVVDPEGHECEPARFDADGRLLNAEACVGEIVNTEGAGPFEGYYNNPDATAASTRDGWYWSGDLGYLDDDRYLYFAGRTAEWIRVDGENFPAGPIGDALSEHPEVVVAVAYGVPDVQAGDQVMAALRLREGVRFDGAAFARWLDGLVDIGPKWRPRYLRIAAELPTTGTNKVVTRHLAREKYRLDLVGGDRLWVRGRGEDAYRPFGAEDEAALKAELEAAGRGRFWEL